MIGAVQQVVALMPDGFGGTDGLTFSRDRSAEGQCVTCWVVASASVDGLLTEELIVVLCV